MKHILVIDDDQHIGDLLQEALTKQGYRVSGLFRHRALLLLVPPGRILFCWTSCCRPFGRRASAPARGSVIVVSGGW